ncbi:MAG: FG-GAP repeat protein, partial [Verrucomicrobiae bacterium]|nr:FG-GAP repeat protein [Verrucomicrobiae bacterium]
AVYVFDLKTGKELRKLQASDGAAMDAFGRSVALQGNLALVGADGHNGQKGRVYVFDASVGGDEVAVLEASDDNFGDRFGSALAVNGTLAVVSGPDSNFGEGQVYLFNLEGATGTLNEFRKFTAPDGGLGFGASVAIAGPFVLVGQPTIDGAAFNSGRAYLFDLFSGGLRHRLDGSQTIAGDRLGQSVALTPNLALVGAPDDGGEVYAFDPLSGRELRRFFQLDSSGPNEFGGSVAACGSTLAVGTPSDDDQGVDSGSAFLYKQVAAPLGLTSIAALKDFAPDVVGATLSKFGPAVMSPGGSAFFCANLAGSGASGGKAKAVFFQEADWRTHLAAQTGVELDASLTASNLLKITANRPDLMLFESTVKGPGVTSLNNRALFDGPSPSNLLLQTGDTPAVIGGGVAVNKFLERVQSGNASSEWAQVVALRTATTTVTKADDAAILIGDPTGATVDGIREGEFSSSGPVFGHFSRASFPAQDYLFGVPLQEDPATNQAVFRRTPGIGDFLIARKGDSEPGLGGEFSTFLGETDSIDGEAALRATIVGGSVTTANDEALWGEQFGFLARIAREGDTDPALPSGVMWSRFLSFWALAPNGGQVLFLAKLKGAGVTKANDCGLFLMDEGGTIVKLLREGDAAPDCDGACIGSIQRVVADAEEGHYAVLVSLTKTGKTANQALLFGLAGFGTPGQDDALRRPVMKIRKGLYLQQPLGSTTRIKGLSLTNTETDASGAGGKGLGMSVKSGSVLVTISLENRAVELVRAIFDGGT